MYSVNSVKIILLKFYFTRPPIENNFKELHMTPWFTALASSMIVLNSVKDAVY